MRHYRLDDDGRVIASYVRPQHGVETVQLPERPSEHHLWDGEAWVPDVEAMKPAKRAAVEVAYQAALRAFEHGGTTWDASDQSATILRDLLNRLANGRGLPRGKSKMTLRNTNGNPHDFTAQELVDLGEAGSDHRDACLDRRLELLGEVEAAETEADLNAIDVEARWP